MPEYLSRMLACVCMYALIISNASAQVTGASEVLGAPLAKVTVEDIDRYILENLPQDAVQRQAILHRQGIFREMTENLYLIRAIAEEAEQAPGFDEAQARWAADIAYQRKVMENYRAVYVRDKLKDVNWDSFAREDYKANPERYIRPERVSAAHILIKTDSRSDEEAAELAQDLHARALAGEDFAELAKAFSEDGSASKGGELGFFQRGKMVRPFEDAAFALTSPGDMSDPVQSQFGYHIIVLRDRKPEGAIPFEEVKEQIIDGLQKRLGNQVWQDKLLKMRSSVNALVDEKVLDEVRAKHIATVDASK